MLPLACVDLPALALQLLLRREPQWREWPVAVLERDAPQGRILWLNHRARAAGVRVGWSFSAGLAQAPTLRACALVPEEVERGARELLELLQRYSPRVEAVPGEPGTWWLDAHGLTPLYADLRTWAEALRAELLQQDCAAAVAVGFTPFGTWIAARALEGQGVVCFADRAQEERQVARAALAHCGLSAKVSAELDQLGVRTVADFLRLPRAGVWKRYGEQALAVHDLATRGASLPLAAALQSRVLVQRLEFECPEADRGHLLAACERSLQQLLAQIEERGELLVELHLRLELEGAPDCGEVLRPAEPTLDAGVLARLLALQLEARAPRAAVLALELEARGVCARPRQSPFWSELRSHRDPRAAERALAELRAAFGAQAVTRARLCDEHRPEARYAWERLESLPRTWSASEAEPLLVRRIREQALLLPIGPEQPLDACMPRGTEHGQALWLAGPYALSGGWWQLGGETFERDYFYTRLACGELLWVYRDAAAGAWYQQGSLE